MIEIILSSLCICLWLFHSWDLRAVKTLARLSGPLHKNLSTPPSLSIVIAARNEEHTLREALLSVLSLDYPNLEIVAVNDRSEDATGVILNDLAKHHSNLKVVHVSSLPSGWLGKTHALEQGATTVTTQWILFTDADIHFSRNVLSKAVDLAQSLDVEHLTVFPNMEEHNALLGMALATTITLFMMFMRPWKLASSPKYYAGTGAFNLVKTEFYRHIGGHTKLKMRPDDDMMLGKLVKHHGGRSSYALADDLIRFSWYESVQELVQGLSKNTYASLQYSILATCIAVSIHMFMFVWPLVALFVTSNPDAWLLYAVSLLLCLSSSVLVYSTVGGTWYYALGTPLGAILLMYILIRTVLVTHYHGGIYWRGTLYSLYDLRKNVV